MDKEPLSEREPAGIVGLVVAAAGAGIAALVAWGVDMTPGQQVATLAVVAPLCALVQAVWTRARVYSPASVKRLTRRAPTAGL